MSRDELGNAASAISARGRTREAHAKNVVYHIPMAKTKQNRKGKEGHRIPAKASRGARGPTASARAAGRRPLLYLCFFASGAAGLLLEVVWSKYLSLLLGNSIHG